MPVLSDLKKLPSIEEAAVTPIVDVPLPNRIPRLVAVAKPVPPSVGVTTVPFHTPVAIVPTEVNEEPVTPDPRVVAERTDVPLIS